MSDCNPIHLDAIYYSYIIFSFKPFLLPPGQMIYHVNSQTSKDLVECKNMTHICHIRPSPFNKLHALMLVILASKINLIYASY